MERLFQVRFNQRAQPHLLDFMAFFFLHLIYRKQFVLSQTSFFLKQFSLQNIQGIVPMKDRFQIQSLAQEVHCASNIPQRLSSLPFLYPVRTCQQNDCKLLAKVLGCHYQVTIVQTCRRSYCIRLQASIKQLWVSKVIYDYCTSHF